MGTARRHLLFVVVLLAATGSASSAQPQPVSSGLVATLAPAEQAKFDAQISAALTAAKQFPTTEAAAAAGYQQSSTQLPGIGTHWINWSLLDKPFDPAHPSMLLFDQSSLHPTRLAGFSYWVRSPAPTPPEGFAGPNDVWHRHSGLCFQNGFLTNENVDTAAQCAGQWFEGGDLWMLHAWVAAERAERCRRLRTAQHRAVSSRLATDLRHAQVRRRQRRPRQWDGHRNRRQRVLLPPVLDVNRWNTRHQERMQAELEPGETVLMAHRVIIEAAASTVEATHSVPADEDYSFLRPRSMRGHERTRAKARQGRGSKMMRSAVGREAGFPVPGIIFVLAVSADRLLFFRGSPMLATPTALEGAIPLGEVGSLRVVRRFGIARLAVLLEAGPFLTVRPLGRRRGLRELQDAFDHARRTQPPLGD